MAKKTAKKSSKRATPVEKAEQKLRAVKGIAQAQELVRAAKKNINGDKACKAALARADKALTDAIKKCS